MKAFGLKLANAFAVVWRLIPQRWRFFLLKGMFVLESRDADAGRGLARLFAVQDALEHVVNERAMVYGQGEDPKHKLTRYHDFFVEHVADGSRVLDVGCGYGAVARSIACAAECTGYWRGLRQGASRASDGKRQSAQSSFVEADATKSVPPGPWGIVVRPRAYCRSYELFVSDNRNDECEAFSRSRAFVRTRLENADAAHCGANYYSDPDHKIEPIQTEFREETARAGLAIDELTTPWGEIWAVLRPLERVSR
jgi:hypothetical protein